MRAPLSFVLTCAIGFLPLGHKVSDTSSTGITSGLLGEIWLDKKRARLTERPAARRFIMVNTHTGKREKVMCALRENEKTIYDDVDRLVWVLQYCTYLL